MTTFFPFSNFRNRQVFVEVELIVFLLLQKKKSFFKVGDLVFCFSFWGTGRTDVKLVKKVVYFNAAPETEKKTSPQVQEEETFWRTN